VLEVDEQTPGETLVQKRAYKAKFAQGLALFNKKPKKGVELLQREGMVGPEPADIARWAARCAFVSLCVLVRGAGGRAGGCWGTWAAAIMRGPVGPPVGGGRFVVPCCASCGGEPGPAPAALCSGHTRWAACLTRALEPPPAPPLSLHQLSL
jgi:hypothetical protein